MRSFATKAGLWVSLAVSVLCIEACKPKLGASCDVDGRAVCQDKVQGLVCLDKKWEPLACRGAKGCAADGDRTLCDEDVAREGDACNRSGETCSEDKKSMLHCEKNHWKLVESCGGPKACAVVDKSVQCDSTSAKEGDPCARESTHACAGDKRSHLACKSGKFVLVERCKGPKACRFVQDKIDCDDSQASVADPCDTEGNFACSTDGRSLLKCKDAKFILDENCKAKESCVVEAMGAGCK